MTTSAVHPTISPPLVARPALHFTAAEHWLNDPHGVCWAGGEYHLFYQHNPAGNEWASDIHWGHATAPDLVRWRHQPIALTPHPGEQGCWTGAALVEDDRPTLFYTSVAGTEPPNWDIGRVAVARPDAALRHWSAGSGPEPEIVVPGPPESLHATVFRDPCLVRTDTGWSMIVGVGVTDGSGLVVQWVSPDARTWTYDGVVCSRPDTETDGVWTGSMWECPQLFRIVDDTWGLVVSVWDAGTLHYNAVAVGRYDGHRFRAERWSRLTYDDNGYAATSFVDREGRPTLMFWLREDAGYTQGDWSGALSLPMLVEVTGDRQVRLVPHPDVDTLLLGSPVAASGSWPLVDGGLDLRLTGGTVAVTAGGAGAVRLTVTASEVTVERPGRPDRSVPVADATVRIVVDAGILMIHGGLGCAAVRFDAVGPVEVALDATGTAQRLAPALG